MIDSAGEIAAVVLAGGAAGMINTIVGSGSLVTFPLLLAFGMPPVTANVTNTWGIFSGSLSGTFGYRRELQGTWPLLKRLMPATVIGAIMGALLLRVLPASAFRAVVPVLIGIGVFLVLAGPFLQRRLRLHEGQNRWLWPAIVGIGVYCGYFGAAQGVMLMAVLSLAINDDLQRINAVKNVLGTLGNVVAAIVFALTLHVDWRVAAFLAVGALIGGQIGASVGRRIPPTLLRLIIAAVGIAAIASFAR